VSVPQGEARRRTTRSGSSPDTATANEAETRRLRDALEAAERARDEALERAAGLDRICEELRESEEDLRDFYEHGALGLQFIDPDGVILRVNPAQLEIAGYPEESYVGRNLREFWSDTPQFEQVLQLLGSGTPVENVEGTFHARGDVRREVVLAASPKVREGRLAYARLFMRDVTERYQAQQAANRLAAIVESSDDAIVSKDVNGIVRSWNRGAETLFGYTADDMIGQSIRRVIPLDRQSEEDEVLRRIRAGERIEHYETVRQRKDGTLFDISLTVSPIKDAHGRIVGASKIARDITDRKRTEAILRESMAAKEQFLSMVSHELRTPIAIVLGVARLLANRIDALSPEERAQALEDLVAQSERLQEVIEHLLILTRMDSRYELALEFMRIERISEDIVATWRRRHPGRVISLDVEAGLPIAFGEPSLTRLVFDNLISNALKYSAPAGEVEVRLSNAGDAIAVEVLDRGIGMSPAEMEQAFEPFFRSGPARDKAGGMGLGLAVSRKVIEAQGGEIDVYARPGGGSCFRFTVPRAETE